MSVLEAYLGLDVSPTKVGWGCVRAVDGHALRCGTLDVGQGPRALRRTLRGIGQRMTTYYGRDVEISCVYVEAPIRHPRNPLVGINSALAVGMALMALDVVWPDATVDVREPNQWRTSLGIPTRPRAKAKGAAMRLARELGFPAADDDAAEGACLARAVWVDLERGRDHMFRAVPA